MDNKKMAQFITKLRTEKNLTQKDLANQLGITDKAVSKWERGLSCPDISLLSKLSNILGITTSELLNGEKDNSSIQEVEDMVETTLKYANTEKKRLIAKKRRWQYVSITFLIILLVFLVMFEGTWFINNYTKLFILPIRLTVFALLIIMLVSFVMGKKKIASLFLCIFFINISTFYYSILNQDIKKFLDDGVEVTGLKENYNFHYTIIIVIFIISITIGVISLLIQNKKISGDKFFLLFVVSITIIILSILNVQSIADYSEIYSVKSYFTILELLIFFMNCVSIALLSKYQRKQLIDGQKINK